MQNKTKTLTTLAALCALSYLVMMVGRIPLVPAVGFLKYDPKDVVITIGGFLFGPMAAFFISLVVSVVEMLTVSDTGPIGLLMNVLSTCAFACTAAAIYKKNRTQKGAVLGLLAGVVLMTLVMLLWNYFITPLYLNYPREAVAAMLLPGFLPFNLIKSTLNAAITMLLYKPLVNGLRRANLLPKRDGVPAQGRVSVGVILVSLLILASIVLLVLVLQGVI